MTVEEEGAFPYCRECAESLLSGDWEEDRGPVDDPVVRERDEARAQAAQASIDRLAAIDLGAPLVEGTMRLCPGCCNCAPSNFNDPQCQGDGHRVPAVPKAAYDAVCAQADNLANALEEIADDYERHNPGWWIKRAKAALYAYRKDA